jgi:predicted porin
MNVRQKLSLAALCISLPALATAQAAAPAAPAAPAAAPKASVTVYGTLNVNLQTTMAKGATAPANSVQARNAVSVDSSNIGVKASAEVAHGLTAVAQCETSAAVDGIGPAGICGRNSRVGLSSAFGTLFLGNWDAPYKAAAYGTKADDPFGNTDVYGFQSLMGGPGFNYKSGGWATAADSKIAGFDIRASNSVGYHSPKLSGASVKLQYSANEFADKTATNNPELASVVVNYEWQGLSVLAAYERHWDGNGLVGIGALGTFGSTAANAVGASTSDSAWRVGAGYELASPAGATTVGVVVDSQTFQQDKAATGALTEYKRLAWQIAAKHRYENHEVRARFNSAGEGDCEVAGTGTCDTADYGATQLTLGYAYHLAKSTQAYVSYTKINNADKAQYTLTIGGSGPVSGSTPAGADPQALGLGIRYAF